jgi:transposase InsO family protein
MVSAARRRAAAQFLVERFKVSERRACRVVGQHRSTQRYEPLEQEFEVRLRRQLHVLSDANPHDGYRAIWMRLRLDGWHVNLKRVHRLWRLEGLAKPPRQRSGKRAEGVSDNAVWKRTAEGPDHVWAYDFVAARTREGASFRILNVVDEFTRECVGQLVERHIGSRRVQRFLEELFRAQGKPRVLRSDNGREFIAADLVSWLQEQDVEPAFIEKGRPQQNGYVERFNGLVRSRVLDCEDFYSILEAQVVLGDWVTDYNTARPHGALTGLPPTQFRKKWEAATSG